MKSFKFNRKKHGIILSVIIFYCICLMLTTQLKLDEKITSMLPDSDPCVSDFKYIIDNIPATEMLYIDIASINTDDNEQLTIASDYIFNRLKDSPYFFDITYRFSNDDFIALVSMLNRKKFNLLNEHDLKKIESQLNQNSINKKLSDLKRNLLAPSGFFMADQVTKDPLGFNKLVLEKLNALKNESAGIKIEGGRIISADNKHVLIMATPVFPAVATKKSKEMIVFLGKIRADVKEQFNGTIKAGFSGNHIATYDNSTTIQKDVKRAVTILSLTIVLIGLFFFKRRIFIFLIFLPTVISLTIASALLSFVSTSVSAIALGCGSVLVGITVEFGIPIVFGRDKNQGGNTTKIIKNLRRPIATAAFTTVTAFTCLLFSSLPGQRQMGLFSLTGVISAAFFASFILKYFIPENNKKHKEPLIPLTTICANLIKLRDKYERPLLVLCAVSIIVSIFGLKNFKFDGDIANLNHLSPVVKEDTDTFLKTWGGYSPVIVLVKADNLEGALIENDRLSGLLQKIQKSGIIDKIASLSPIFPSSYTQNENIQNWHNLISKEKQDSIRSMVQKASLAQGFSNGIFEPFFGSLKKTEPNLEISDFENTAIIKMINGKLIRKQDNILVMTTFNIKDRSELTNIKNKIKAIMPESLFLDKRSFVENTTGILAGEFKKLLYFAAIGMIISLFIFMRKIKIVVVTIIPVFLSILMTAGILGLIGVSVNLISMLFIIFVFGVGVDFSIFLINMALSVSTDKSNHDVAVTEGAVILCAMTTIGAFISLVFAQHSALYSIGVAGFTGMITSLILAVILIPVLAKKIKL